VPLAAAIRDEQTAKAKELVEAGGALLLTESEFTAENVANKIESVLQDGSKAQAMADAALGCARPNATADIAHMINNLAGKL
jgi:UDP-N-acetylglucosamine--N-acetylmuramyl-(pentapeptide) pyrophosphoryl-undecaprenol N-acetylglucosamine transferase